MGGPFIWSFAAIEALQDSSGEAGVTETRASAANPPLRQGAIASRLAADVRFYRQFESG